VTLIYNCPQHLLELHCKKSKEYLAQVTGSVGRARPEANMTFPWLHAILMSSIILYKEVHAANET